MERMHANPHTFCELRSCKIDAHGGENMAQIVSPYKAPTYTCTYTPKHVGIFSQKTLINITYHFTNLLLKKGCLPSEDSQMPPFFSALRE
ncbi:hypothetical protein POVWA2_058480 [Plasmodium ovale wallikeri]|uniref:Uncharacterized protein n=1 Tax=Plasmodium ovale wallikeri TaxID=864142 RepID=A0A1A9A0D4_PLAOA|nr:hypothetical protein POVWA1_059170 [Plasmodium ovale wallikeri]SBT49598.1 hypothetical protein POVWA2_058480 [Plasmodium ovale wallikeri]